MEYEPVIGLETHVQLKTKSKMWCGCANAFGAPPNTNVCPVCLGMPGVLPVANDEALRLTVLTGLLLHCEVPPAAKFDRKNYFYPDVAKNYQITQYDQPSTKNGYVDFEFGGGTTRVRITRAHLEEDVGKNFHFDRHSGVDFNRAGVPLLEIVSEPDLTSADMAYEYLNALKEILMQGGISDCDMEKGMVRCDVNVSVRPKGTTELGAKIEIKNMNSFSGVRKALEYEIPRQIEVVSRGNKLVQSTRRWDDLAGVTEEMRTKEHAHDYRYFPEPDLMPFHPTDAWLAEVRARVVELPMARKQRFMRDYQLPAGDAAVFKSNVALGNYFEGIAKRAKSPKAVANWVINNLQAKLAEANALPGRADLPVGAVGSTGDSPVPSGDPPDGTGRRTAHAQTSLLQAGASPVPLGESPSGAGVSPAPPALKPDAPQRVPTGLTLDDLKFQPDALLELVGLIESKTISSSAAQQVFVVMFDTGKAPAVIVQENGLAQVSDTGAIEKFCDDVIAANPGPAADFKAGKTAALNFLKGQVMKASKGKANPSVVGEILERKLKG